MKNITTNSALLAGEIISDIKQYDCCGEQFYSFTLAIRRESGVYDEIPVNASKYLLTGIEKGMGVELKGQIRTYNKKIDGKNKLIIVFFTLEVSQYVCDKNEVEITGYFCKQPLYRVTPFGRSICDVLIATNRERGKSDYIPGIVWGRTAQHIGQLSVGIKVNALGRLQSRNYEKKNQNETITATAYEVSINRIQECIEEV